MAEQQAAAVGLDREYETIYVLRPDVERERAQDISDRVSDVIGREGGKLTRIESWGRRRLAYPVEKHTRGVYVYLKYVGRGGLVSEIERNLRLLDVVLKYQTVKVAGAVKLESYQVAEEDLKYEHVEPMTEEEAEESKARLLGLEDHPRVDRSEPESRDGDAEGSGDDGDDRSDSDETSASTEENEE
jgi:small subunit ribosomal protein S6